MKPLAGRMWWSFYESDASFENFVIRALAYVTRQKIEEVRKMAVADREQMLLAVLNREPYLIVLMGWSGCCSHTRARTSGDCRMMRLTLTGQLRGRRIWIAVNGHAIVHRPASPSAYIRSACWRVLKKLTLSRASRILISTRLYPADLQTSQGGPFPSCFACFLRGLTDDDALSLWRGFGAKGSRETMLPMLTSFDKHPLLVQALASVVSHDPRAVGDFDLWCERNPGFDPFPLLHSAERKSHVLSYALRGIDKGS